MAVIVEQQVSGSAKSQASDRKRRWHHKTATGCATCRQRRVKCGEERPGCARCAKQGRVCPGYSAPKIWMFDPQKKSPQRTMTLDNKPQRQLLQQPSSSPFANSDGSRSFQFYFELSEPNVSKFFSTQMNVLFDEQEDVKNAILETDLFWKVQFPRLFCLIPIIQHCTIFMTTCHDSVVKATYTLRRDPECISKYTSALHHLRKGYNNVSVDCILLASLLLAMGELSYGPSESGLSHLYNASRIIEQRQRNPSIFDGRKQKEELEGMQKAVSLMFRAFFRKLERESFLPPTTDEGDNHVVPSTPQLDNSLPFSTLQQATSSLEEIKQAARRLLRERGSGEEDPQESAALQSLASTWMERFEAFVAKQEGSENLRIACIVVHLNGCATLMETKLLSKESDFDSQISVFTTMAEAAEEFVERTDGQLPDAATEHLNYGVGPVNPLFYATTKCRHFTVRRRLLRALRMLRVSEGPWTSCTAFQIASYLAGLEGQQLLTLPSDQGMPCKQRFRFLSAEIENLSIVKATLVLNGGVKVKEEEGGGAGGRRGESEGANEEVVQTATFHIIPCGHQSKLPTYLGTIGEVGGWEGYVRNSTCTCRDLCAATTNLNVELAYRDRGVQAY